MISLFIDTTVIHNITHHGNRPEVLAELRGNEERQFDALDGFLTALAGPRRAPRRCSTGRWSSTARAWAAPTRHSNVNLPVLLAGGGFRHGQHLAFDTDNNYPLTNLFVSMLQRLGIEAGDFSTGRSTMRGLEMA